MTTNKILFIDETHAQVTKAFYKQARIFGTPEYKLWRAYLADFPNAQMVTKTIKKNPEKQTNKNHTYANMEEYIRLMKPELLPEFQKVKKLSKVQPSPYHFVLTWFYQEFPEHDDYKRFFEEIEKKRQSEAQQGPQGGPEDEALSQAA